MTVQLNDIISPEFQEEIQDSFALATGFGVVFVDKDGNHLGEGYNFCKFCKKINKIPEGRIACANSNKLAIDISLKTKKPSIYICHAGLINIEIPLFYSGEYIGAITAGQVICEEPEAYPRYKSLIDIEAFNRIKNTTEFENIKVLSIAEIEATERALYSMSKYMVQTAKYNKTQKELFIAKNKKTELEHQLKLAELYALQKQVAPHFIFNVINIISRLISMENYDTAKKMLDSFSGMLRYTLSDIHSYVTLEQEISYIKNYISIQKIRFGNRIDFDIFCDPKMKSIQIPFFAIQPLVENSIEHGLLKLASGGKASLICKRYEKYDEIHLVDNGIGISKELLKNIKLTLETNQKDILQNHIGIINSYRRLLYMYDDRLSFEINSEKNNGCEIIIRINHI